MDRKEIIEVKNVKKDYKISRGRYLHVLKGIDISIFEKEIVSIAGPSGAGKSTLLHIIGTLDKPTSGEVIFDGSNISKMRSDNLAKFRNSKIGFIFQFHHLLPEFSALENVALAALIGDKSHKESYERAESLLNDVGLGDRVNHKPSEISGGEAQRVAIARALVNSPKVILADEPTGNLDSATSDEIIKLLFDLRSKYNETFVIVTHNEQLAGMTDRTIHMADGQIVFK